MIRLTGWVFGKNATEVKCPSYRITPGNAWYPCAVTGCDNFDQLVKIMFATFIHSQITIFFPFTYSILWKQVNNLTHTQKGGGSVYTYYFEFHVWEICLSSLIYVFMSVWTHVYLFYTLGNNPALRYYIAQIFLALEIGGSFRLAPVSLRHAPFL